MLAVLAVRLVAPTVGCTTRGEEGL